MGNTLQCFSLNLCPASALLRLNTRPSRPRCSRQGDMIDRFFTFHSSKSLQQQELPAARKLSVIKWLTEFLLCGGRVCQCWSIPPNVWMTLRMPLLSTQASGSSWSVARCVAAVLEPCVVWTCDDCGTVGRVGCPMTKWLVVQTPHPSLLFLCPLARHLALSCFGGTVGNVQTGGPIFFATSVWF